MKKVVFIILIVEIFLAIVFITTTLINKAFKEEPIQIEEYIVSANETLWDIAKENKKEKQDIREYVYTLRKLNNIDDCIIHEGQAIKIIK